MVSVGACGRDRAGIVVALWGGSRGHYIGIGMRIMNAWWWHFEDIVWALWLHCGGIAWVLCRHCVGIVRTVWALCG